MPGIVDKIESLPDDLRRRVEGYVDALHQVASEDRRRFAAAVEAGLGDLAAGRKEDDAAVWQRISAQFGPLGEHE